MRRTTQRLLQALDEAKTSGQKAKAHYALGLFHDNNNRESEAIPYYRKAIRHGLSREFESMARAWLASSLYKTGSLQEAVKQCDRARKMARNPKLIKFLDGLRARIQSRRRYSPW
jgi:tetratricopeptide (TPR) repeat protein